MGPKKTFLLIRMGSILVVMKVDRPTLAHLYELAIWAEAGWTRPAHLTTLYGIVCFFLAL